jgi:hypothetical protein
MIAALFMAGEREGCRVAGGQRGQDGARTVGRLRRGTAAARSRAAAVRQHARGARGGKEARLHSARRARCGGRSRGRDVRHERGIPRIPSPMCVTLSEGGLVFLLCGAQDAAAGAEAGLPPRARSA